ncbi:MAG: hypothetical protein AB9856_14480 [Cellulosilyticaceae bacterium]
MADEEIKGMVVKLAMEDGSFQDGINNLNRQMRLADSEFKSAVGNTKNFGDSVDGLKSNLERLNRVSEIQTQLIEKYEEKLDKSKKTLESTVQAQLKLTEELNGAKSAYNESINVLGKNAAETIKLKNAVDDLQKKHDQYDEKIRSNVRSIDNQTIVLNNAKGKMTEYKHQLEETAAAMDNFGKETESVNTKTSSSINVLDIAMGNLMANGVQMVMEGLKELANQAIEFSKEMDKLSLQTGMSTDELQQWDAVLRQTGSSILEADGDMAMLAERINEASMGTGEGKEVWDQLGLSVLDTGGKLKSQGQVLDETVMALQNMEDVTKRNALASQLLGTTGENLMPILNGTNEELKALKGNANIMSENDIERVNTFRKSIEAFMDGAGKELMGILADVAVLLTPIIKGLDLILQPVLKLVHIITEVLVSPFAALVEDTKEAGDTTKKTIAQTSDAIVDNKKETDSKVEDLEKIHQDKMKEFQDIGKTWAEKQADKQMKRYEDQYKSDTLANALYLDKKRKQYEEYYSRLAEMKTKAYGNAEQNGWVSAMPKPPAYDVGTQYHMGGLAYVHKDELIDLNRGAKVYNKDQTQQMMRGGSTPDTRNLESLITQVLGRMDAIDRSIQMQPDQMQMLARSNA